MEHRVCLRLPPPSEKIKWFSAELCQKSLGPLFANLSSWLIPIKNIYIYKFNTSKPNRYPIFYLEKLFMIKIRIISPS